MGTRVQIFSNKSFSLRLVSPTGLSTRCLSRTRLRIQTLSIWMSIGCVLGLVPFLLLSCDEGCRVNRALLLVDRSFMRWKFQTDTTRSYSKIITMPFDIPPLFGIKTRRTFRVTVVAPDSKHPLNCGLISPPHYQFFPSVTSTADAYVVYTFEVGVRFSLIHVSVS